MEEGELVYLVSITRTFVVSVKWRGSYVLVFCSTPRAFHITILLLYFYFDVLDEY